MTIRKKRRCRVGFTKYLKIHSLFPVLLFLVTGCAAQYSDHEKSSLEHDLDRAMSPDAEGQGETLVLANASGVAAPPVTNRKIVYDCEIDLQVDRFSKFETQIGELLSANGGFTAQRTSDREHTDHTGGVWILRVPVDRYNGFLAGVSALGFATKRIETAEDVTEAYVDLEARITNKKKLESRILDMLDERSGKLSDLMEMERELSRVREEIERMEGRMRVLADQTSLATITVNVTEKSRYVPPSAPTFAQQIGNVWGESIESVRQVVVAMVLLSVAIVPWMILLVPIAWLAWRNRIRLVEFARKVFGPQIAK